MNSHIMFGEWLRQRRDGLGLTRKEFARRVGCSVSMLRKIEDGERRPSGQIAELMANCLDIPSAEHSTFVRVARGELNLDRLSPVSELVGSQSVSPASTASAPPLPVNLPVLPTPLIGRQREVEELSQLLRDPQCRLLTLVGPGGIGKTRLAIETASHMQDFFANGVHFIPLAPINTTHLIVPVIADAIGFAFQGANPADPKTQLFNYLAEKQSLLLIDNLEHLLNEPGTEVLAELLANASQVKLLTTSRESLGLQGEWVFEVQGLPIPETELMEKAVRGTSIELFLQRARRAHVGFDATPQDYPAIVRICQLVEGNPLGIELAAAWVRTLSCGEIAKEIEGGLDILSVSVRDIPARHRSMRAVFDHSWRLLTEEEQGVLLRLSVFRGGFRREAAEQVAEATLAVLSALVTKSLVRRSSEGRYDLHELIRQFAAEHFSEYPDGQTKNQARHCSYYLTYFNQADTRLRSAAQRETLAVLSAEMDNFRAAWDWAVANHKFDLIERSIRATSLLFDVRGWYQEGLDMLDPAINVLDIAREKTALDRTHQVALGHLLMFRSVLATRLGQFEQAQSELEHSMEILRPLNNPRALVGAVTFLGNVMEFTGNYVRASELYSEGLEIAEETGDRWFAALCRLCQTCLMGVTQTIISPKITRERLLSVVADWREVGDPRLTAIALNNLSWTALKIGLYDEARITLEESISLSESVGDRWALGFAYRGLGVIAQVQGKHLRAVDLFRKSLGMLTELGMRQDVARALAEMSRSIFALGDDAEAERGWREALRITTETQGTFVALEALAGLAALQLKRGEIEQAFELLLIVLDHPASIQDTKDRASHLRAELESRLTPQQIEALQARAQAKSFAAVVDEILKSPEE